MKHISTKLQKRIMFIPVINLGNFFIAVLNCCKTRNPTVMGFKVIFRTVCILLPITFLSSLLIALFPRLDDLFFLIFIYIGPVCMSYGLINLQDKKFSYSGE